MKSKNTASFLAFFLGGIGIHRFYLGQTAKGIFSLIFFWTYIPLIIGLIDFVIFITMSEEKFNLKYNPIIRNVNSNHKNEETIPEQLVQNPIKNIKVTVKTLSSSNNDDSIIDITDNYENIRTDKILYEYDSWKLGNRYKEILKLNKNEVQILNELIDTDNKFNSIKFCAENLIRLFFDCLQYLDEYLDAENHSIIKDEIIKIEIKKYYKYRDGSLNFKNASIDLKEKYNQCIYKSCENQLREYLNVGRKTDLSWYIHSKDALDYFENKIGSLISTYIKSDLEKIKHIDLESEITINNYNRSRYKNILEGIKNDFKKSEINLFKERINELDNRNNGNPYIENIYFEASKFISKYDKKLSLEYYVKYIFFDLKSATFDNKQHTKTIQKSLFKTNEQLRDFGIIVSELIKDKNLEKALKSVSKVYEVKRKKIKLDTASIKEVQKQHSSTVELLNEYLKDDFEDENNTIKSQEISDEEIQIEIIQKNEKVHQSAFVSEISFTTIQTTALELFAKSNFLVSQDEFEVFSKSKGVFKNSLIESINDTCYEFLDDILIEEEEEEYTINANYFQKISIK